MRREELLVVWHDAGGTRRQVADQLGLRRRDSLDRAQQLEVDGPDVDDHADVRLGDRDQLGDLADAAHGHLEHERLGSRLGLEERHRQADLRVQVLAVGVRCQVRAQQRREDVLRGGLAGGAGDADRGACELAAPLPRQALQRSQRIVRCDHGLFAFSF